MQPPRDDQGIGVGVGAGGRPSQPGSSASVVVRPGRWRHALGGLALALGGGLAACSVVLELDAPAQTVNGREDAAGGSSRDGGGRTDGGGGADGEDAGGGAGGLGGGGGVGGGAGPDLGASGGAGGADSGGAGGADSGGAGGVGGEGGIGGGGAAGCVDLDDDGFGAGCLSGDDCDDTSAAANPLAPERCNGGDDDCDGSADEAFADLGRPCTVGQGQCGTNGRWICGPDGAGVVCDARAREPAPEACNAEDDDCDGAVDEGVAACCEDDAERPCGTEVGACEVGVQRCDGREWAACRGETPPRPETCNGADDDCDGRLDEGTGTGEVCSAGVGRCARPGVFSCVAGALRCDAVAGAPAAETCDGTDEDCDGVVDEAFPQAGGTCNVGVGACARSGPLVCASGAVRCGASAGAPGGESCNGQDDDCDGPVDEGVSQACGSAVGQCRVGAQSCAGGAFGVCVGAVGPGAETCNGQDDDCDGRTDEDVVRPCGQGGGGCQAGIETCAGGVWGACSGAVGPRPETCNGVDDDCDGQVDEAVTRACGPSNVGACRLGTETCTNGSFGACVGAVGPRAEACNNVDDDCDARVDEQLTRACGPEPVGQCRRGTETCASGSFGACAGAVNPIAERCNLLDDDCDGRTDEAPVQGAGAPCELELGVCRSVGTTVCSGGSLGCNAPAISANPEVCNQADDDCDGRIDEGYNLNSDFFNCGGCGNVCDGQTADTCSNGTCSCGPFQFSECRPNEVCQPGGACCPQFGGPCMIP